MTLAIAMCGVATVLSRGAAAEKVALVRPHDEAGVLADAFNRLQAELELHHFEPAVVEVDVGSAPVDDLAKIAQESGALASIAFVRRGNTASVDIWLLDRVSGKTTMRRLDVGTSDDAASVLAFRAVDLLRISLREYEQGERPPQDVVGVDRRPLPASVLELTAPPAPTFRVRAEAVALYDGASLGFAYGPALGIHRVLGRLELGVIVAGPLLGSSFEAQGGSASLRQELAFLDARFALLQSRRFAAGVELGLGGHFLQAASQAEPPLRSGSDSVSAFVGSVGLHGELFLSRVAALTLSLRALAVTPRQGVALASERVLVSQPLAQATAGVVLGL